MQNTCTRHTMYINSANRLTGTPSSFTYMMQCPTHFQCDRLTLIGASLPTSFYVVATGDNTFILTEKGTSVTITVPPGNYSIAAWCALIPPLMNAASPNMWTYAMTYNLPLTQNFNGLLYTTVVSDGVHNPSLTFAAPPNYIALQFGQNLGTILGGPNTVQFTNFQLTSINVCDFVAESTLLIHCSLVNNYSDDVIAAIYPGPTAPNSVITFQQTEGFELGLQILTTNAFMLQFSLTDEYNQLINLNGVNWNCTLLMYKSETFYAKAEQFMRRYAGLLKAQLTTPQDDAPEIADTEAPSGELPTEQASTVTPDGAPTEELQIPPEHVGASSGNEDGAMVPEQPSQAQPNPGSEQESAAMEPQGAQEPVLATPDAGLILPQVHLG